LTESSNDPSNSCARYADVYTTAVWGEGGRGGGRKGFLDSHSLLAAYVAVAVMGNTVNYKIKL